MKNYKQIGTNETGNTIYKSDYNGKEMVFVGNDGYDEMSFGKWTIQVLGEGNLWNQIENGIVDTEKEASDLVKNLIADGFCEAENIRYEQI